MRLLHLFATCGLLVSSSFIQTEDTPFHLVLSQKLKFDDLVLGQKIPKH